MLKIKYLRIDNTYDDQLRKISETLNIELRLSNYNEVHNEAGAIFLLDIDYLKIIEEKILESTDKVIIAIKSKEDFKKISHLEKILNKVFGFLDLTQEAEYNMPIILNYANSISFSTPGLLNDLSNDLNKILKFSEMELERVKELHDKIVKLRSEKLRCGQLQMKFMAGESSGGEYFDFLELDNQVMVFIIGTDSYVTSTLMITELELFKINNLFDENSVTKFTNKLKSIANENNSIANYLVFSIKLSNLEVTYHQSGNGKVFNGHKLFSINGNGMVKLARGEKIFFLSEGLLKNWEKDKSLALLENLIQENKDLNNKDLINEVFIQIVKNKESQFLKHDALMGVIEIDSKVLHKI